MPKFEVTTSSKQERADLRQFIKHHEGEVLLSEDAGDSDSTFYVLRVALPHYVKWSDVVALVPNGSVTDYNDPEGDPFAAMA